MWFKKNGPFTVVARPTSIWQMNQQIPGFSLITSYLIFLQTNEWFNRQQWNQHSQPSESNASGPIAHILTVNGTGMHKVIGKSVDLPQWFFLIHDVNKIDKPSILVLASYLWLMCFQCELIQCLILLLVRG